MTSYQAVKWIHRQLEKKKKKMRTNEEIIKDIKSVLDKNVKDNVAMHNSMINFLSYDNGTVRLEMAGDACSGCAMSKQTLHEGVERMLKHYVPEVNKLIGEDDELAEKGYTIYGRSNTISSKKNN